MAGARASFFFKQQVTSNKGLKAALHARDLVEFCRTLQTGVFVILPRFMFPVSMVSCKPKTFWLPNMLDNTRSSRQYYEIFSLS